MSTEPRTSRDSCSAPPPGGDLPLFRFGLRQFLLFVTLVCLLMAAMATLHGLTALVLLLATLVVGFHVFSTALGSQLRGHANRTRSQDPPPFAAPTPLAKPYVTSSQLQSRSPWHERRSTPLPWRLRWIAAASLLGCIVGALLLGGTIAHRSSLPGIALGSFSMGVVAGWCAFILYSFFGVFRHGLRDAMTEDRRDRPR